MPILDWVNKKQAVKTAGKVPYRVLMENKALSYGDQSLGNMLIKGDNLETLKALLPYYKGQVKCIYIDPPYNTGSAFTHYDDNLEHSTWLSMMYPRLELLRQLLAEDGVFFVQIDDNEQAYLKVVCDEVFGRDNFVNCITVKMSETSGVKMMHVEKKMPKLKEYLLVYRKSVLALNPIKIRKETGLDEYLKYYNKIIINKKDSPKDWILKNIEEVMSGMGIKISTKSVRDFKIKNASAVVYRTNNKSFEKYKIDTKIAKIISPTGLEYIWWEGKQMLFLSDYIYEYLGDFWSDISTINLNKEGYADFSNSKKPERLIERIITLATNPGDLVLDSFLGSGTTAAVAQKMGRKYIGIEMGQHAITHCAPRLKAVIDGTDQGGISKAVNWQGGGGFTFYDLGPTIFDEEGNINRQIDFKTLAFHIWFAETKTPMQNYQYTPLLGVYKDTAYYLLYNGILGDKSVSGGNVLTAKLLDTLPKHKGKKIIYGEATRLTKERLTKEQIIFKQTPYEIKAR